MALNSCFCPISFITAHNDFHNGHGQPQSGAASPIEATATQSNAGSQVRR